MITTKQLVNKEESVRLKVRVEYKKNITATDLPANTETLSLGFTVNYVQADNTRINVNNNGILNSGVKPVASGDINEIGTIVTIGDQQFYTIGIEGENVKLLSMYNLYVGGEYNSGWTAYGSEATGKQDSTMLGVVSGQSVRKGTTEFSSSTQKGTNYSDYSGSIVEGYVNAYKGILEGEEYGIDVVEARLISYDELTDSETFACVEDEYYSSKYHWIYSTSYWSGSASGTLYVWFVRSDGYFGNITSFYYNYFGVRPVIVLNKSEIVVNDSGATNKIIEFTIDGITYQAEEGMTWGEWLDSEYNTGRFRLSTEGDYIVNGGGYPVNGPNFDGNHINYSVFIDDLIEPSYAYGLDMYPDPS